MTEQEPRPVEVEAVEVETIVVEVQPDLDTPAPRPRKVYAGMWGTPEIAAVAVSTLVVLLVMVVYFFWVIPSDRELARNRSEADRLEAEVMSARSKYGEITDTQTEVGKLVGSVEDFEARFLPISSTGQTALYQKLNGLIAAYGLVNSSGPDYSPLETTDFSSGDEEKGRSRFRSLYPGVYVTTTVEGSYQNLRRFIREIETGRDFIVVSAVELAPSDKQSETSQNPGPNTQPNAGQANPNIGRPDSRGFPGINDPIAPSQAPGRPQQKGKTHGETVSLRIELAAYFRRPNFAPVNSQ
ncbi:hypothetical protein BH20ACI2_BH20ACI2_25800 [soil metagenome]